VIFGGLAAAGAWEVQAQSALAPSPVQFALTGITLEQTARLTVTAVVIRGYPPGPCRALLRFVDAQGKTLTNADGQPAEKRVVLSSGESAYLDVQSVGRDVRRLDLRPVVFDRPADGRFPPGPCLPQLEILDTPTQSTLVLNPGVAVGGWTGNHNETLVRDAGE
jgi:hypothetical protein